jgi:hypothetical protein
VRSAPAPAVQLSTPTPPTISGTTTPPSIEVQGNNPATINVGDTYTDLGAIVHDNQGHDLGYKTFLNGALVSNIVIDTSQVATAHHRLRRHRYLGQHVDEHPHRYH